MSKKIVHWLSVDLTTKRSLCGKVSKALNFTKDEDKVTCQDCVQYMTHWLNNYQ